MHRPPTTDLTDLTDFTDHRPPTTVIYAAFARGWVDW